MSHEETIALIRAAHRKRCFMMEQRKRAELSVGAFLRVELGWSRTLPEKERKDIAVRAQAIIAGKDGQDDLKQFARMVLEGTRAPFEADEERACKQMEKLAATLPVWKSFGADVRGLGARSLAVIVGEAGDLSLYSNHSKLWKRMCVAVMDGKRQGGLTKTASKDDWIAHGYSPRRRSRMWNIGDALIKAQVRKVKDADGENTEERIGIGRYGETYLRRKAYELTRDPEITPMHAHRRAQRYMEKRLLRDLWQAWRRAVQHVAERPIQSLPAAQEHRDAA